MTIPSRYQWLAKLGDLPNMVDQALKLVGTVEVAGSGNSPKIMAWAKETGLDRGGYTADSVPWCGLFMAVVAKRAGYAVPAHPLWALNWQNFGKRAAQPCLGDVLVFVRPSGGHVGLYIAEDRDAYHVLGGNQSDAVNFTRVDKSRLKGVRSPLFKVGRPASSRPYIVAATGTLSVNEA